VSWLVLGRCRPVACVVAGTVRLMLDLDKMNRLYDVKLAFTYSAAQVTPCVSELLIYYCPDKILLLNSVF
jgi:hypothetical protein